MKDLYLIFTLGRESYGINILHVIEILGVPKITEVPNLPKHFKGLVNMRGSIVPVLDLRLWFGMEEKKYSERTCLVIVGAGEDVVGLIVDGVDTVREIQERQIEPPPKTGSESSSYISGLGKINNQANIMLDLERLVQNAKLDTGSHCP